MSQEYNHTTPRIKSGEVYHPILPDELQPYENPIVLAEVEINLEGVQRLCIQLKFSEFIHFEIIGINSKLNLVYRLVREDMNSRDIAILQEWPFGFEALEKLEVDNLSTSQPTVLNYCDQVDSIHWCQYIYRLEIIQIETHQVKSYKLTNKSFIATVLKQTCCRERQLPYIKQAEVFNPVLPNKLNPTDPSIVLAQVPITLTSNGWVCLFINFSGFVTSSLRGTHFNNLLFRLVKVHNNGCKWLLNEWAFRRAFINDTLIKEPIVYNYCECLLGKENDGWIYRMELVGVDLSTKSFYEITQKSMTVQVDGVSKIENTYCCRECEKSIMPKESSVICGKLHQYPIESERIDQDQSVELARTSVVIKGKEKVHLLINYSQNFSFTLDGFNPKILMTYRLIRLATSTRKRSILESWTYKVAEIIGTQVEPITSIEPLVLNYCDELKSCEGDAYIYSVELEQAVIENARFIINPKEIVAIVSE